MVQEKTEQTEYNEDELHAPEWLNKKFFEVVLHEHEAGKEVVVQDVDISPGSGKGDHYASIMFRAKINYRVHSDDLGEVQKQKSLIIKTMPEAEGMKKELMEGFTLFEKEIQMYSEILPQMEAMLRSVGDNTQLCAKMIYSALKPRQCIIFEDLVVKGYKVVSNRSCNLDEVKRALGKLARIHAASMKILQNGNTDIPQMASEFSRQTIERFEFMQSGVKLFKEVIETDEELRKYIPYVEKVEDTILEDVIDTFDPEAIRKRVGIKVLNHGDFHMKNMMVNYSGDTLTDLMLVDYQISYYGSPALDLVYASIMMFSPEMRHHQRDVLYSHYIENFQETLRRLDFTGHIPTKTDFEHELKQYKRWELYMSMVFLIFPYCFVEGKMELGEICEKADVRLQFWQQEKIFNDLRVSLPRLVAEGFFD